RLRERPGPGLGGPRRPQRRARRAPAPWLSASWVRGRAGREARRVAHERAEGPSRKYTLAQEGEPGGRTADIVCEGNGRRYANVSIHRVRPDDRRGSRHAAAYVAGGRHRSRAAPPPMAEERPDPLCVG